MGKKINLSHTIEKAVENQLKLNDKMKNKNWRDANLPFYRACWFESAEKLEHINWEWWKKRSNSLPQVHLECADILHFLISDIYMKHYKQDTKSAIEKTNEELVWALKESQRTTKLVALSDDSMTTDQAEQMILAIETYISAVLSAKSGCPKVFFDTCLKLGLDMQFLFKLYFAKSVLNNFRQDNGDKEGTYARKWRRSKLENDVLSDNDILYQIVQQVTLKESLIEDIYDELSAQYELHKKLSKK